MSIEQVIAEIHHMSDADFRRVTDEVAKREDVSALDEAAHRAAELDNGSVSPASHEEVFSPLKKRFGCN
jgi:hypothetical protein